jgi:hypothetical protein
MMPPWSNGDATFSHSLADPDVVYDEATQVWHLYFSANAAVACTDQGSLIIKHATSPDGLTWTVQEAPALGASPPTAWDALNRETPTVVIMPGNPPARRWVMYYAGARRAVGSLGFNNYELGVAFSPDGNTFTRLPAAESPHGEDGYLMKVAQALPAVANISDGVLADPEVVLKDGVVHLYFSSFACGGACSSSADTLAFGVSHASSTDGITFTVTPGNPVAPGQQPAAVYNAARCEWEMWVRADSAAETALVPSTFNQAYGFRRWTSMDGVTWASNPSAPHDFVFDSLLASEKWGLLTGVDVVQVGNTQHMFYVAFGTVGNPANCYVYVQEPFKDFCFGPPTALQCVVTSSTGLNRASR